MGRYPSIAPRPPAPYATGMERGPLDDLFPGLRRPPAEVPDDPVHPRVLALPGDDCVDFGFVVWSDPGGPQALHGALRERVEATLLSELSRPATHVLDVPLRALRLVVFAAVDGLPEAVRAFGFRPDEASDVVALARGEASALGREVPDDASVWRAPVETRPLATRVAERLRGSMNDEVFGARPGALFARLNVALEVEGERPLPPRLASLDALEALLVPTTPGVVRWIPTLVFQALCDAVGVVAARDLGREVQWAECAPDADGLAPPPLLRASALAGWAHLPVGLELLRWCVMPVAESESVPPLSAWLTDRLGA